MYLEGEILALSSCTLCPRNCKANRFTGPLGFCKTDAEINIASICIHKGEEPVISGEKGICNVFFNHCNLQCLYCQNHDISLNNKISPRLPGDLDQIVTKILSTLEQTENMLGFVSPTHQIPQMMSILRKIHERGVHPVVVYNTNGYEKAETLKMLEGIVDVYLTDFKYSDSLISQNFSQAADYPEVATAALKEMYRQKGASLITDEDGLAVSGIILRHLVLPNEVEQSKKVLNFLADEISTKLHISLMAQYFPVTKVRTHPTLNRTLYQNEYQDLVDTFHDLGFYKGWIQELESQAIYRPDFFKDQSFEL